MPGYHVSRRDKGAVAEKYFCMYCLLLLRDAMQTSCGHFYCQSCLVNLIKDETSMVMICLKDQTRLLPTQVFADKFMRREILALVVYCTFVDDGCHWKGEVRHLESHTSICEFLKLPCVHPGCGVLVKKADLPKHLKEECMYRLEKCPFCQQQVNLNKMKVHQETDCPTYPVRCGNCNREDIPRRRLRDHQDAVFGDCENVEGPCPFSHIGCPKKEILSKRERKKHLEEENIFHTSLLLKQILQMTKEIEGILTRNPSVISRNPQLLSNFDGIVQDILNQLQSGAEERRNQETKLREHSERITLLERTVASRNVSRTGASVQRLPESEGYLPSSENSRSSRRHDRRIESIEHTLALRNVTLADLEEYVGQQEFSSYDGQVLWRISDYARKRNDAVTGQQVSFYSPCFFSSRYGYKMCARIYLNGDGMGRGTHISIFFVVMRGQYDALLRWPFRRRVTFMLLDQDNVEHVIDAFRPDPNSSSFQRPRRETNIASGCPMFCSLAELNNHAYVRNDTMFLKIIVDTTDL